MNKIKKKVYTFGPQSSTFGQQMVNIVETYITHQNVENFILFIFHKFIKLENFTTSCNSGMTNRQIQYLMFSNQILRKVE